MSGDFFSRKTAPLARYSNLVVKLVKPRPTWHALRIRSAAVSTHTKLVGLSTHCKAMSPCTGIDLLLLKLRALPTKLTERYKSWT